MNNGLEEIENMEFSTSMTTGAEAVQQTLHLMEQVLQQQEQTACQLALEESWI